MFNVSDCNFIPLGKLAKIQKGQQINGENLAIHGTYYVMNGGTKPSGYLETYNTPANTISISEGGSCGYVQFNTVPFWSGGHCYTLLADDTKIVNKFLYHYLKYKEPSIMALRVGSGLPNIQKKDLESFLILNISPNEQLHIVNTLDKLTAIIQTEKLLTEKYEKQKNC